MGQVYEERGICLYVQTKILRRNGNRNQCNRSPDRLSRPDWALMLAMYCGAAHAEDNKIAERTKDGNHEHLMRGEWVGKAPRGYRNVRAGKHNCWIEIDKTKAPTIKKAFEEVAKGLETPTRIRKRICPYISDSSFFDMLRNPFYAGIVRAPAYKNDAEQFVEGKHEALIDKRIYDKVQAIINGKGKKAAKLAQKQINPDLYLRKFLVCPVCGHPLTGATSTGGHGGKYTYYFCNCDHKHINTRAEKEQTLERYNKQMESLKEQIGALRMSREMKVQDKLDYSINIIGNLGEFFRSAKPEVKVLLLGSIFPQRIEFDGKNYRTRTYNRMLDLIYQETNKLQGKKNKKSSEKSEDFNWVPGAGVEPAHPFGHWCLRPTRLPIPPSGHCWWWAAALSEKSGVQRYCKLA